MPDMLVKLYDLPSIDSEMEDVGKLGVKIKRALTLDAQAVLAFVDDNFRDLCVGWRDECQASLLRQPVACFIGEYNGEIIGFASYDASAKGYFGPFGVREDFRRKGVGAALLLHALHAMYSEGYGYAIIGWVSSESYYKKAVGAISITGSEPGLYARLLGK